MKYSSITPLFIIFFALFSCQESPKEEQNNVSKKEVDTLGIQKVFQDKYNTLNQTHEQYKQKYAELEVENIGLKADSINQTKEIAALKSNKNAIAKQLKEKIENINELKINLQEYKEKYDKGELTEDEFGNILDDYEEVHQTLDNENRALQVLAQQNEALEEQLQEQSDEIELSRNQVNAVTPVKEFSLYYYRSKSDQKKKLKTPLTSDAEHASTVVKQAIYLDISINKDLMYFQQGVWEINDEDSGVKVFATLFEKEKHSPLHTEEFILNKDGIGNLKLKNAGLKKGTTYRLEISVGNKVLKEQSFSIE
jgi:hypothetical protein